MDNRDEFIEELQTMLASSFPNNRWLKYGQLAVYLRVQKKIIEGNITRCVTLANLGMAEKFQRRGTFTSMLEVISGVTDLPIYVENVHNVEFRAALLRRGFVSVDSIYDRHSLDVVLPKEKV